MNRQENKTEISFEKFELYIGLSYCHFLKGKEKLFLAGAIDNLHALEVLSTENISEILQRKVKSKEWQSFSIQKKVEDALKIMKAYDIKAVSFEEDDFPHKLREIPDPPFMIFYRGILPPQDTALTAMVGTRRPTGSGIRIALQLAEEFAALKVHVVSGLAIGIDSFAHRGCVEAGGLSTAVLACSPEQIYPRTNKRLAVKLLEAGGCIMSEYPPFSEALKYRFPQRNRIISGLSDSVIVVEAPAKSGALITADFALEQGRNVFVCENLLTSQQNEGGKLLHEQGAPAITAAKDIFGES